MVTKKDIDNEQKKFMEDPKESIREMLKVNRAQARELPHLDIFQGRPDRLSLYLRINKEYFKLVGKVWKEQGTVDHVLLRGQIFEGVGIMQRLDEQTEVITELTKVVNETTSLKLGRIYASSCEILWKKLRKIVYLCEFNPERKRMNIHKLLEYIKDIELKYSLNLENIKYFINSNLRNSVGHEDTYFEPPDTIVFVDTGSGKAKEVGRRTVKELYEELIRIHIVLLSLENIENTALVFQLLPFLEFSDKEMEDFIKKAKSEQK